MVPWNLCLHSLADAQIQPYCTLESGHPSKSLQTGTGWSEWGYKRNTSTLQGGSKGPSTASAWKCIVYNVRRRGFGQASGVLAVVKAERLRSNGSFLSSLCFFLFFTQRARRLVSKSRGTSLLPGVDTQFKGGPNQFLFQNLAFFTNMKLLILTTLMSG